MDAPFLHHFSPARISSPDLSVQLPSSREYFSPNNLPDLQDLYPDKFEKYRQVLVHMSQNLTWSWLSSVSDNQIRFYNKVLTLGLYRKPVPQLENFI